MFRRARIGLLGGSFNPAHAGHLNISRDAILRLRLDEVWWLVSPQNPLKSAKGMADLDARVAAARGLATDRRVRVTCVERAFGTVYTIDTLNALARHFPRLRFAWLMGADNLAQIPAWRGWTQIFHAVSVAVFARPSYSMRALAGAAAGRFARDRRPMREASSLLGKSPPAWVFLHSKLDPASASAIRARRSA